MQRFRCPFCGFRDETEFHYAVEAGKPRPEPAENVGDEEWANYLYFNKSAYGKTNEIWIHKICGEFFFMCRDSVTREIYATKSLDKL